jgi:hypothetical protein
MIFVFFLLTLESSYFLKLSPGVMSQGLGGSSVVISEGLSVFHNPAYTNERIINFTLSRWLYSTNYLALGGSYENYAFGLAYMNYGSIQGYDSLGMPTSAFTPYNICIGLGRSFGRLGIAIKGFAEKVYDRTQYGVAGSIGYIMQYKRFTLGVKVDNLGKELSENSDIPYYVGAGLKFGLTKEINLIVETKYPDVEVNSGFSYTYQDLTLLLGTRYVQGLNIPAGNRSDDIGFAGGLMLTLDNYRIGYSFVYGYLSLAHQFNVTFTP